MIDVSQAVIGFFMMLGFMALGLHAWPSRCFSPASSECFFLSFMGSAPLASYGNQLWSFMNDFLLTSIPLFVLLGELLLRSGVTDRMYRTLSIWLAPLPGGLLHTNVGASSIFAAVSGSSVATAATISTVALRSFGGRRYNERLVLGSIAAGATLGILIPPSVNLIIFGALTNTSIGQLFVAGIIGIGLTLLFMASIILIAQLYPSTAESSDEVIPLASNYSVWFTCCLQH